MAEAKYHTAYKVGRTVLVSYETNVACVFADGRKVRTDKKWTRTTQRHMRNWGVTNDNRWEKVPQNELDNL